MENKVLGVFGILMGLIGLFFSLFELFKAFIILPEEYAVWFSSMYDFRVIPLSTLMFSVILVTFGVQTYAKSNTRNHSKSSNEG